MTKAKNNAPRTSDALAGPAMDKVSKTMTQIDSDLVRQLAGILNETGLSEVEYESGGTRIRVARTIQQTVFAPGAGAVAALPAPSAGAVAPASTDLSAHPGAVKSPMVGVVYYAAEPGAAPFVKVGDSVTEGQTLVLIEAMKTFNPVKAPRAGKVARMVADNGAPVEYGEVLVIIE